MYKKASLIISFLFVLAIVYGQHQRNIIIYNTTSTDCGPCSCMDSIFNNVVITKYPNTIILELHDIGSNENFKHFQGDSVVSTFKHNPELEPSCFIDGLHEANYLDVIAYLDTLHDISPNTLIDIQLQSKTWNPDTREVSFDLYFKNEGPQMGGDYYYNVIVTENNLISDHRTKDSCSTPNRPGLPIDSMYVNNDVVRKMVYWSKGDNLVKSIWEPDQSFTKPCTFELESGWNAENCNITVDLYWFVDSLYKSPVTQAIRQKVTAGTGIDENNNPNSIIGVYPNPASSHCNIHFKLKDNSYCDLYIVNESGHVVKRIVKQHFNEGSYNTEVQLDKLADGYYIIVLKTDNRTFTKPFVKK